MPPIIHSSRLAALLVLLGACSFRSLDYLNENGPVPAAGSSHTAGSSGGFSGGIAGASSGTGAGGQGTGAVGGGDTGGGSVGSEGGTASGGGVPTGGSPSAGGSSGGAGSTSAGSSGTAGFVGTAGSSGIAGSEQRGGTGGATGGLAGEAGEGGAGTGGNPYDPCLTVGTDCPLADEVAYALHPGHQDTKCADIEAKGVDDGAVAIQYTCGATNNQVFYAEAHGEGYFALRSAMSGRCLSIVQGSLESGASVEQRACAGEECQLFHPERRGDDLVRLTVKHSGLDLQVAGSDSSANGARLLQGAQDTALDSAFRIEPVSVAAFATLSVPKQSGVRLRHDGVEAWAESSSAADAEWKVVTGLGDGACVSFESRDTPGAYLRHRGFLVWAEPSDGTSWYDRDATFCFRAPLSDSGSTLHSLESVNYPGRYVSRSEGRVELLSFEDTPDFRSRATWSLGQL